MRRSDLGKDISSTYSTILSCIRSTLLYNWLESVWKKKTDLLWTSFSACSLEACLGSLLKCGFHQILLSSGPMFDSFSLKCPAKRESQWGEPGKRRRWRCSVGEGIQSRQIRYGNGARETSCIQGEELVFPDELA